MLYFDETSCLALAEQIAALEAENVRLREVANRRGDELKQSILERDRLRQEKAELVGVLENVTKLFKAGRAPTEPLVKAYSKARAILDNERSE